MGRFALSFKAWWRVLRDADFAERVQRLADAGALPSPPPDGARSGDRATTAPAKPQPPAPARSYALNLLSVLQREARLIDFLKENITPYSNEQVGAAVRDVHRDAAAALDRMFALRPAASQPEGSSIDVPAGFDAARTRLVGNVSGNPPYHGTLRHPGWEAASVQLPQWSGSAESINVIAPAEVELK
jgi:hypothetical protein